jgi:Ser/Thr protein kinase RdoA (MazF antagonist)
LQGWANDLELHFRDAKWLLPQGLVHGGAHTGNVLSTADGRFLFCDLDSVYYGPREWDIVPTAHSNARFGRPRADYLTFADGYGVDVAQTELWPLLCEMRELQPVTTVLPQLPGRPALAEQLGYLIRTLKQKDAAAVWTRYV